MRIGGQIAVLTAFIMYSGSALAVGAVADVSVYDRAENRTLPALLPGRFVPDPR
ncbi:MAG: hypothetical protein AABZ67_08965 [Pseudomonadota bacterium]